MPNQDGKGKARPAGTHTCTCSSCGSEVAHERGIPCSELKCPQCASKMQGDYCRDK